MKPFRNAGFFGTQGRTLCEHSDDKESVAAGWACRRLVTGDDVHTDWIVPYNDDGATQQGLGTQFLPLLRRAFQIGGLWLIRADPEAQMDDRTDTSYASEPVNHWCLG